jgi:hypothetical protein
MASAYDKASLVMLPHATKEGKLYSVKPEDRSGDFTFSRGTSATRVNASGLIEKERGNFLLQSNKFNTTWSATRTTLTSGQSGYDGSNDAWLLSKTVSGSSSSILQYISKSGVQTYSIYAKSGTTDWLYLEFDDASTFPRAFFNLNTGVVGTTSGLIDSSIESVGGGWYRCSITSNVSLVTVKLFIASANGDTSTGLGTIYIQDAQLEQGLVATDYIETTTAAVYEGITDNLPRLDYSGGASCPSLLLEPSRTNYVRSSEYYDTSANWILSGVVVEDNYTTSPEGLQNASKVTLQSGTAAFLYTSMPSVPVGDVTISCWAKADSAITIGMNDGSANPNSIDLTTEWKRFEFTFNYNGFGGFQLDNYYGVSPNNQEKVFYLWGCQAEAGSYPTSYIPTYGTAATRTEDSATRTSISHLIGQTEGVLYFEGRPLSVGTYSGFCLTDGTTNNEVLVRFTTEDRIEYYLRKDNTQPIGGGTTSFDTDVNVKVAFAYKSGDSAVYINGTLVTASTTTDMPSNLSVLRFARGSGTSDFQGICKNLMVFPTRLTNAELAALTTL